MGVKAFFKSFGSKLSQLFGLVKRLVPDELLDKAVDLVATAGKKFVDNAEKREWVVKELMRLFPISESLARLIAELAVTQVKNGINKGAEKVKEL